MHSGLSIFQHSCLVVCDQRLLSVFFDKSLTVLQLLNAMKYILVHWTASNETSILTEEFVRDKSMLKDVNKEGMVRFGKLGCKEPKGGWKAYLGRVIFINGESF